MEYFFDKEKKLLSFKVRTPDGTKEVMIPWYNSEDPEYIQEFVNIFK